MHPGSPGSSPIEKEIPLGMAVNEELYEGQQHSMAVDQRTPHSPAPRLTSQEQMFVAALNSGASKAEAGRRCGISLTAVNTWLKREDIQQAREIYLREFEHDILPNVKFTKDDAHHMYMEAYRNSGNATEQIKATDSLVKLHGLDKPEQSREEKEINTTRQLENMSAAELLKVAGYELTSLTADDEDIEDAEFSDDDA